MKDELSRIRAARDAEGKKGNYQTSMNQRTSFHAGGEAKIGICYLF